MRVAIVPTNLWAFRATIAIFITVLLVGCTPPYPTRKHTLAPAGTIGNLPSPSNIQPGKSRRDEVVSAFKGADVGVSVPWLFWARWKSSSAAFSAVTDTGVEQIPIWSGTNLLVEFDQNGTVMKSETLPDERIVTELQRIIAAHQDSTKETSPPTTVQMEFHLSSRVLCPGTMAISAQVIEFSSNGLWGCPHSFTVPLRAFTVGPLAAARDNIGWLRLSFKFSDTTPFGSQVAASLRANDLFSLLYFLQTLPAARH